MAAGYFTCVHLLIYILCCCYLLALAYFHLIYVTALLLDVSALPTPSLQSCFNDLHTITYPTYRQDLQTYDQDYGFNRRYDITNSETDQHHRSQNSRDGLAYSFDNLGLNHNRDLLIKNPAFERIVSSNLSQDGGRTTHVRSLHRPTQSAHAESPDTCMQEANPSVNTTITGQETASYSESVEPQCPGEMFNISMCDEDGRRRTFVRWPHTSPQPEQMARCGFYLTNYGDEVRCFWCGAGIVEWQPADDPWLEHVRVSPTCEFIRQIRQLRMDEESRPPHHAEETGTISPADGASCSPVCTDNQMATTNTESPVNTSRSRHRSYRIDEILDSRVGRRVLRQGYSRSQVANVIRSLIEGNWNLQVTFDMLMGALMSMEVRPSRRRRSHLANNKEDI